MSSRSSLPNADIDINILSWQRHMRATNLAPSTQEIYLKGARQFVDFLAEQTTRIAEKIPADAVAKEPPAAQQALSSYCQALFSANAFLYVD